MNIDESTLKLDQDKAKELYKQYRQHADRLSADDEAIAQIYLQIAKGNTVVRALHAITVAGLNAKNEPNLAIARADCTQLEASFWRDRVRYFPRTPGYLQSSRARSLNFDIEMPGALGQWQNKRCAVPLIPIHLRPKKNLEKYHILFEADWHAYPVDPFLLRRVGRGDAWLVVVAWDLTDVERAVMSQRLNA